MQRHPRYIALFALGCFIFLFLASVPSAFVRAQGTDGVKTAADKINVKLQVPLPFVSTNCPVVEQLPDGTSRTVNTVCNLHDYITGVYRLLIGTGALFAVVMIIIAGYQWMLSGGSSDKTGAAKKRIFGAAIGLILALLSYIILNAITPRLVELRLPQVDPVKPIFAEIDENFCRTSQEIRSLYQSLSPLEQAKFLAPIQGGQIGQFNTDLEGAKCGTTYLVAGNRGQCQGSRCTELSGASCIDGRCYRTFLYGNISWSEEGLRGALGFGNAYVDKIKVYAVCNDGVPRAITAKISTPGETLVQNYEMIVAGSPFYRFERDLFVPGDSQVLREFKDKKIIDEDARHLSEYHFAYKNCEDRYGGFKGYVLEVEVNDDKGAWGNFLPTLDDDFVVGRNCSVPIAQVVNGKTVYDFEKIDFTKVDKNTLFSVVDFNQVAQCDINITRESFPAR